MNDETRKLVQIFADRLINHKAAYYRQWDSGNGYTAIYEPITLELIESHLRGDITLSLPVLDSDNQGHWICFDSDSDNGELDKFDCQLKQWDWYTIREGKRTGKAGHLLLLFNASIPGKHLVNLANAMVRRAGISTYKLDVFPRQAKPDKLGSAVKLPLAFHRKIGERVWFDLPEKNIQAQLAWFAEQPLNDSQEAIKLAELWKPLPPARKVIKNFGHSRYGRINILDYVHARRNGKELAAQCPICRNEGARQARR